LPAERLDPAPSPVRFNLSTSAVVNCQAPHHLPLASKSERPGSVAQISSGRPPPQPKRQLRRTVTISTVWSILSTPAPGPMKLTFRRPKSKWSTSKPTDQFGVKPYSKPPPTVPPRSEE